MVAAWSRVLSPSQRRYSVTDREWLAVVECVTRVWKHWLLGRTFVIRTDHSPLRQLLTTKGEDFTYRQLRWFEKLEPYSFRVEYLQGKQNQVADALSRTPEFLVAAVQQYQPEAILSSLDFQVAVKPGSLLSRSPSRPRSTRTTWPAEDNIRPVAEGKDGRFWVPQDELLRFKLVLEAHEPPFAGHFGTTRTEAEVLRKWWWHDLHQTVLEVVGNCDICQRNKNKMQKDAGPYRGSYASEP